MYILHLALIDNLGILGEIAVEDRFQLALVDVDIMLVERLLR